MTPNLRADKVNDQKITSIIRRSVEGDYNHYADAWHPALKAVEIDLACAGSSFPQRVAGDFLAPTLSTRPPWVKAAMEAAGEWVLVIDDGMQSSSADALWLIQAVERPSHLLSLLENQGVATDALMMKRQVKGIWLVAIQSSVLKDIIKKSQRTNY
jgi:hypothetical protein